MSPAPTPPSTTAPRTPEGTLLVTDFGADTVTFVDPAGRGDAADLGSVRVGTAPYGIALGEDGTAWVATAEGVAAVDTRTRERTALIPYRTDTGPVTTGEYRGGGMGIALSPDGRRLYVGVNVPGGNGTLEVVDTGRRQVTRVVPVGRRPFDVDVSRDGRQVYATNHDSFDVSVVDTDAWTTRRIEVAPYGTEGGLDSWLKPHYTAVRPSDGALLLPFEGERLAVVDPGTGRVDIEDMTADTHQHGVTAGTDGTLYVVGTGPIDPDEDDGPSPDRPHARRRRTDHPPGRPARDRRPLRRRRHRLRLGRLHPRRLLERPERRRGRHRPGDPAAGGRAAPGRRGPRRRPGAASSGMTVPALA
ncbi:hypothetical protein STENM36S_01031 [Streptomyces tendae]